MKHYILSMAAMSLHQTQAFVSNKPFHHKIKVHSTTTNKNIFNVDVNRPSASFLSAKNGNYSTEVRLREEAEAPFRKVRFFVYSALLAGCTISLLVSAARIAAGLNGINADLLDESLQNAGIDLGGLALLSFLLKQDFDAQESRLKRASKGGQIASLQVRFASPDPLDEKFTTLNLSSFRAGRGIDKRVVIIAGGEEKIDQVIDQISDTSFQDALTLNDLVVIPLVTTNGVAPNMNEDLLKSNCIAIPTGRSWKEFIDEEISSAESQGVNVSEEGFALILKKNGRVGQRTKGINLSQMVGEVEDRRSSGMDVTNI